MNEKLINLIKKAQGDRTQNEFALHSGISSSTLTRILLGQRGATPGLLSKLASHAYNGVGYSDFMIAAGYMENPTNAQMLEILSRSIGADYNNEDITVSIKNGEAIINKTATMAPSANPESTTIPFISNEDKHILELYHSLDDWSKRKFNTILESFAADDDTTKTPGELPG